MATTPREPTAVESALATLGRAIADGADDATLDTLRQAVADAKAARDATASTFGNREHPCYWGDCAGMFLTAESARQHGGWDEPIATPAGLEIGERDRVYVRRYCALGSQAMTAVRMAKRAEKASK